MMRRTAPLVLAAFLLGSLVGVSVGATAVPTVYLQPGQQVTVIAVAPTARPTPSPTPRPTATPTPTPAPTQAGIPVPASIDSTGTTNVTAALATFLSTVPDGSTVLFEAGGTYQAHIQLVSRNGLVLEGNGATIKNYGWTYDALNLKMCDDIVVHNLILVGDNADAGTPNAYHSGGQEYSAGIWISGSSNVEISDVRISRTWGDSIYIGSWPNYADWSDTISIHDSVLELNGRNAVVVDAGRNVTVERNTINASAMHVLDIEPFSSTAEGATNVMLRNNTIGSYGLTNIYVSFFFAANGIDGSTVRDITVSGNTVAGNDAGYDGKPLGLHTLVVTARRTNITVTNNTCTRPADGTRYPGAVMFFRHVDGLTVTGNVQPLANGVLIRQYDSTGVTVQ